MPGEEALCFLGLARKAGKLVLGEEQTRRAVRNGKAKQLLLAKDAAPNAVKRAEDLSESRGIPLIRLEADKIQLADALGAPAFAMAAICDAGFAAAFRKKMQERE